MTIAIGIYFNEFILLAADTRTTYYDNSGDVISFHDESEKIVRTKMGLMTGAGNMGLLDAVKSRFKKKEIGNSNELLKIIGKERCRFINLVDFLNLEPHIKTIESTGWIFTYVTKRENIPLLRLAIYHPSLGNGIGLYKERQPAAIFPHEASKQEAEELGKALENIIRPFNEFKDFASCIKYHLEYIGSFIDLIQPNYPSISSSCQFGIHALEGVWLSPIIKPREVTDLAIAFTYSEKD